MLDAGHGAESFAQRAPVLVVEAHGFVLTPGRYVGAAEVEEDDEPAETTDQPASQCCAAPADAGASSCC